MADEANRSGTKIALEECPPSDEEARALFALFAIEADTVYFACKDAMERTPQVQALDLDDVLSESYVLFLRSMVRYDRERGELAPYLGHALRVRVKAYVKSMQHETSDEEDMEVEDVSRVAPGFDIPELYQELKDEGRLPSRAQELWDQLAPA